MNLSDIFKVKTQKIEAKILEKDKSYSVICNQIWYDNGAYSVTTLGTNLNFHDAVQLRKSFNDRLEMNNV